MSMGFENQRFKQSTDLKGLIETLDLQEGTVVVRRAHFRKG